nr:hypothetical protein [uncultured Draconibacterium sp.]
MNKKKRKILRNWKSYQLTIETDVETTARQVEVLIKEALTCARVNEVRQYSNLFAIELVSEDINKTLEEIGAALDSGLNDDLLDFIQLLAPVRLRRTRSVNVLLED